MDYKNAEFRKPSKAKTEGAAPNMVAAIVSSSYRCIEGVTSAYVITSSKS
jgi:hypothetical protein